MIPLNPTTHEATATATLPADELDRITTAPTAAYDNTEHAESRVRAVRSQVSLVVFASRQ